jgi:hypothetical protein
MRVDIVIDDAIHVHFIIIYAFGGLWAFLKLHGWRQNGAKKMVDNCADCNTVDTTAGKWCRWQSRRRNSF